MLGAQYDRDVSEQSSASARAQLPRGVHALSREEVVASQRGRLMLAMAEVVAEKGYAATSVADVLKRAGVSRVSFYEHFANKEACFAATYDIVTQELTRGVSAAIASDGEPVERASNALRAYLETLAGEPDLARIFLIDSHGAGPEMLERRFAIHRLAADVMIGNLGATTDGQRLACESFVGAIVALVSTRIMVGDVDGVRALHSPIMKLGLAVWGSFDEL